MRKQGFTLIELLIVNSGDQIPGTPLAEIPGNSGDATRISPRNPVFRILSPKP